MVNWQGVCASHKDTGFGGVFVFLGLSSHFLTCAVNSAAKIIELSVWVSADSGKNRPWAFLWAPLLEFTPESRREEEWNPLPLRELAGTKIRGNNQLQYKSCFHI